MTISQNDICIRMKSLKVEKILIGTSGYSYKHWKGVFYPDNMSERNWLEFYSHHFSTVELNVTFYRLPKPRAFETWNSNTPSDFRFVIKGSRYITHIKRLMSGKESIQKFFAVAEPLYGKLVCVLWQLPPTMKCDVQKLSQFITDLKEAGPPVRHAFEFRHETWYVPEVFKLLKSERLILCIPDSPYIPRREVITSDYVYLRFHGGTKLYGSEYSEDEIEEWAQKIKLWIKDKKHVLVFFNNDAHGFAIKNAVQLKKMLDLT